MMIALIWSWWDDHVHANDVGDCRNDTENDTDEEDYDHCDCDCDKNMISSSMRVMTTMAMMINDDNKHSLMTTMMTTVMDSNISSLWPGCCISCGPDRNTSSPLPSCQTYNQIIQDGWNTPVLNTPIRWLIIEFETDLWLCLRIGTQDPTITAILHWDCLIGTEQSNHNDIAIFRGLNAPVARIQIVPWRQSENGVDVPSTVWKNNSHTFTRLQKADYKKTQQQLTPNVPAACFIITSDGINPSYELCRPCHINTCNWLALFLLDLNQWMSPNPVTNNGNCSHERLLEQCAFSERLCNRPHLCFVTATAPITANPAGYAVTATKSPKERPIWQTHGWKLVVSTRA